MPHNRAVGTGDQPSPYSYVNPISIRGQIILTAILIASPPGFSERPTALSTQHIVSTTRVLAQYEQIRAYLVSDSRFDLSQKEKKANESQNAFFPVKSSSRD